MEDIEVVVEVDMVMPAYVMVVWSTCEEEMLEELHEGLEMHDKAHS